MNLECLNNIITTNLAIHIDLTDIKSWDLNTNFTTFSLTKWSGAISDNINLIDFGLSGFDNGRTNIMWSGITVTPEDVLFSMHRVGYNVIQNPISGETSGITITTEYDLYPISGITTGLTGNYFDLNGGYLQGFFKLNEYNYELLPSRYNNGITIETLLYLYPNSQGIFYMMGTRAEDKYNPYFSGETLTGITISGITTSLDNYLDSFTETQITKKSFSVPENNKTTIFLETPPINNIENNVIAFEITQDKKLAYKYINNNGLIITNKSNSIINPTTGWTIISIVFKPNEIIDDLSLLECTKQRIGKLIFYVNGRAFWIIKEFPEFYFKSLNNNKEKQIGVPYSISWGGGSFGLKHSWHYDYYKYNLYDGQDTNYINNKFFVQENPIPTECNLTPTDEYLPGLSLSADSKTFYIIDNCNPDIQTPITVMRVEYTGTTGTSANTYFIKFNQPISVLSNRNYEINLSIFNNGFFKNIDNNGNMVNNKISLLIYGTTDINIINDIEYVYPLIINNTSNLETFGLYPFPDKQEYEYIKNGVMYYGTTGLPVTDDSISYNNNTINQNLIVSGENSWKPLKSIFRTNDNTGQHFVYIGLLIETNDIFNLNKPLYINDYTYTAADILVQDNKKNNLTIEQNFNSGFIGGIQKLRIYDNALTSPEILHNAIIEANNNINLNLNINKGGRIIYR